MRTSTFSKLLVRVPLLLAASLASAQTGEIRTGGEGFLRLPDHQSAEVAFGDLFAHCCVTVDYELVVVRACIVGVGKFGPELIDARIAGNLRNVDQVHRCTK